MVPIQMSCGDSNNLSKPSLSKLKPSLSKLEQLVHFRKKFPF